MSLAFLSISFEIFNEQFNFLSDYNELIQILFLFSLTIVYFSFFYWIYNLATYLITDFKKVKNVFINVIILFILIVIIGQIENFFPQYIYILKLFQFLLVILLIYSPVFIIPFILSLIWGDPIKKHFRNAQLTLAGCLKTKFPTKKKPNKAFKSRTKAKNFQILDFWDSLLDKLLKENLFLFSWNNVPGKDNKKLLEYFNGDLGINWVECADICKSDDDKTIRIFKDEKSIEIIINKNEMKAILIISDNRTYDLEIKKENGKLNIYEYSKNRNCISQESIGYISLIDIFFISEDYTAGIKKIKQSFGKEIQFDKIINSNTKQSLNEMLDQLTFSIPYYILCGRIEQMKAMNTHLENLNKYIGDNYSINGSQFITEIIRMSLEIEKFLKVNSFEFLKIEKPRDDKYIYIKKQIILGSVTLIYSIILIKLV